MENVEMTLSIGNSVVSNFSKPTSLLETEKKQIVNALGYFGGSKPKAAEALGITTKTLYNKLDQFGLKQQYVR